MTTYQDSIRQPSDPLLTTLPLRHIILLPWN
jgi:hypothetical protein